MEKFQYTDTCLDLEGGINPADYPICVINKTDIKPEKIFKFNKKYYLAHEFLLILIGDLNYMMMELH